MRIRIKSTDINKLCESLQKISLFEDDLDKSDIQKDDNDGKFYVDINAKDTDSAENIANNINDSDEIEAPEAEKEELKADFINEVKDYLDTADALKKIIKKYNNLKNSNVEVLSDNWELNTKDNDVTLPSKGLHVFKQNKNICLSHEGEVEIFNNINELKEYLKKNEYQDIPENLISQLHESTIEQIENLLLEWGNEYLSEPDFEYDECCGGACGAVTTSSIAPSAKYTALANKKDESILDEDIMNEVSNYVNYETNMNKSIFVNSCVPDILNKYNSAMSGGKENKNPVKIKEVQDGPNGSVFVYFSSPLNIKYVGSNQLGDRIRVLLDPNAKTSSSPNSSNSNTSLKGIFKWIIGGKPVSIDEAIQIRNTIVSQLPKRIKSQADRDKVNKIQGIMWDGRLR